MTQSIKTLIERLEKASGADRELDAEIFQAINPDSERFRHSVLGHNSMSWVSHDRSVTHPRFTDSIDSALTLVPEGWRAGLDPIFFDDPKKARTDAILCRPNYENWNPVNSDWIERLEARGNTPAIALCIAALKSREAQT